MDDCFFSCFFENEAIRQYENGNERARKAGIDKNRNTVHNSRKQGTHAEKLDITASKCTKAVNRYEKQKENHCFQNTSACSYPATSQPPITDACQISCQYDPVTDPERKKIHHNCQTEDSIQKRSYILQNDIILKTWKL